MDRRLPASTLTDAQPSLLQRRFALVVIALLVLYSLSVLPIASQPGPVWPSFIGIYQAAIIVCDLLTAILLLYQFRILHQVSLLILGTGYLFTALIACTHLLSFPGLFGEQGLIGGPQTTNWLWIIWHGGFPLFVLGYVCAERKGWVASRERMAMASLLAVCGVIGLVGTGTLLATSHLLPQLISGRNFNRVNESGIGPALALLCLTSLLLIARERGRSVIKLWLAVAMLAFSLDVLHTLHSGARFAVGWYAARGNSFVASIVILTVYVVENGVLLRHWIASSTELAQANAKLFEANRALQKALERRQEAEQALHHAKNKAEEILSSITDGFYALDADWRFTYINQRARTILGRSLPEVMGRHFFAVFPQVRDTEVHAAFRRVMDLRRPENLDFISPILKRWTSFSVYPAGDGGISVYFRDISDRKAAEQALIAAKEEAERANQAKSQFLASASHDLRQPVQSLYFFHEAIAGKVRNHPAAPLVANMQSALDAMKSLLDGLLDISKLHAGTVVVEKSTFPAALLLARIVAENTPRAAAQGIALRFVPSRAWVCSDLAQLERMLRNLVDNALKYTPEGGAVLLGCRHAGNLIRILVADTGPGIPENSRDIVFEEFVQLDNPERDRSKGLGLGLAIVRHLARLLDHSVTLQSKVGHGTCVSISVPAARRRRDKSVQAVPVDLPGSAGMALVVDDEALVLVGVRAMLEGWGWEVIAADSGREAVRLVSGIARPPDVIIADYRLRHGETGVRVIRDIHGVCGVAIPALVLTGDTSPGSIAECTGSGFALIHKPVDAVELRVALKKLQA